MFTDGDMTAVFHALAHESRRKILDILKAKPGIGVGELAGAFDVTRIAVMNHLAVLEQAGLVISEKDGRVRRLYLNVLPIQLIHERWTSEFSAHWASRLTGIKYADKYDWIYGRPSERYILEQKAKTPALYDAMHTQRNTWWAEKIDSLLGRPSGVFFVLAGQNHVNGPDSIQICCERRGIAFRLI